MEPLARDHGEVLEHILCFLQPRELCRVAQVSSLLREYAYSDVHWRFFTLRDGDLESLAFGAARTWRELYVRTHAPAAAAAAAPRAGTHAAPMAGGGGSAHLAALAARSTLVAQGLHPCHLSVDALRAAAAPAAPPLDATWMSAPGLVPYVPAPALPPARFRQEFEAPGRPAVICGLVPHWPAAAPGGGWQPDALAARLGGGVALSLAHRVGAPYGVELPLRCSLPSYLRYARSPLAARDELPLYVFESAFGELAPSLLGDYDPRSMGGLFPPDLSEGLGRAGRPAFRWLVVGGPRSGTPWHWDPHGTSAWNTLLAGTKRWLLYPPGWEVPGAPAARDGGGRPVAFSSPLSPARWLLEVAPHLPLQARPVELLQRAGETVFIPSGWWHAVLNVSEGETVSVTQNWAGGLAPPLGGWAEGPSPPLCGNLLPVVTDLAAQAAAGRGLDDAAKQGGAGTRPSAAPEPPPPRRLRAPVGPNPDAHGLAVEPHPSLDAGLLRTAPPHEALRMAALAAPAPAGAPHHRQWLADAFRLCNWHLHELPLLVDGAQGALHRASGGAPPALPHPLLQPWAPATAAVFTSQEHWVASFGDAPLYAGLLEAALQAAAAAGAPPLAVGTSGALNAAPLTSRTNPTFSVSAAPGAAPPAVVVKLFSPFVCEDGGRAFQPAAALAGWRAEAAALAHGLAGACAPTLLAAGFARAPAGAATDTFTAPVLAGGHSGHSGHWQPRTVPVTAAGGWCWPFLVTRFVGGGGGGLTSWAAGSGGSGSGAGGDDAATEHAVGRLLCRLHASGEDDTQLVAQLLAIHADAGWDAPPPQPLPLGAPVTVPLPSWAGGGGAPSGVRLPWQWAPYFSRLLSLRLTAEARRERTRSLPLHLLQGVGAFLPPVHQLHVLLPLRVHPAHLPPPGPDGVLDLCAPGVLPRAVPLHGDLTPANVLGAPVAGEGGWRPTAALDFADACVGDALWDVPPVLCALLGGRPASLGRVLRAYDAAAGGRGCAPLAADPSLPYRLVCLLLLHPVDGALPAVWGCAGAPPPQPSGGDEGDLLHGLRGAPFTWADVMAAVAAAL